LHLIKKIRVAVVGSNPIRKGFSMLVLTRRAGEEIVVNGDIHITVLDISKGRIRLGITAPATVAVNREEVLMRKAARIVPQTLARKAPVPAGE
jgi:carbon storage regulator